MTADVALDAGGPPSPPILGGADGALRRLVCWGGGRGGGVGRGVGGSGDCGSGGERGGGDGGGVFWAAGGAGAGR